MRKAKGQLLAPRRSRPIVQDDRVECLDWTLWAGQDSFGTGGSCRAKLSCLAFAFCSRMISYDLVRTLLFSLSLFIRCQCSKMLKFLQIA